MESLLNVQPATADPSPRVKPPPKTQHLLKHVYHHSEDGSDENLLILLHGLGKLTFSLVNSISSETPVRSLLVPT